MSKPFITQYTTLTAMPESADMGRNLLRGAGLGSLDTITEGGIAYRSIHSGKDNMQAVVDGIDGNKGYQITTGSDEKNVYRGVFFIAAVNKGETYTLSAWVKGTAGNTLWMEFINNNGTERKNSDGTSGTYQSATFNLTDGWQRVSHTFTVDNKNAGYVECNFFTNESGTFTICEPKLERGDVATAFCLNEADLAAAVYEIVLSLIFNASYSLHTDESNSADNNALDLTISGGFSVYSVVDGVRKLYDGDDLSFGLIAFPYSANGKVANGTGTVSLSQSNIDAELAPVTAYLAVFRGTQDNTLATKNITISMHPGVLIDKSNGLLVKVNNNTDGISTIKSQGDNLSFSVEQLGKDLKKSGIDLDAHTVHVYGDNVKVDADHKLTINGGGILNVDMKNFQLDDDGNMTSKSATLENAKISGTISQPWAYSGDSVLINDNLAIGDDDSELFLPIGDNNAGRHLRLWNNAYKDRNIYGFIEDQNGNSFYDVLEIKKYRFYPFIVHWGSMVEFISMGTENSITGIPLWKVIAVRPYFKEYHGYAPGIQIPSLAYGRVDVNYANNAWNVTINGCTFDGSGLSVVRKGVGDYVVCIDRSWYGEVNNLGDGLYASVSAYDYEFDGTKRITGTAHATVLKIGYVSGYENGILEVMTADDETANDSSFFFEIKQMGIMKGCYSRLDKGTSIVKSISDMK